MSALKVNSFMKAEALYHFSIFLPRSPDLSSCWGALAPASGSIAVTSCAASSWMWPLAQALFSMGRGCGIEWHSESKVLQWCYWRGETPVFQLCSSQRLPSDSLGCQKSLVLETSGTWLLIYFCFGRDWLCSTGSCGFVPSISTGTFPSCPRFAAFLEGRLPPSLSPRMQQQRSSPFANSAFSGRVSLQSTWVVSLKRKTNKNNWKIHIGICNIGSWGTYERDLGDK